MPLITQKFQWEPRAQQDGYNFRDSLQFVLNTYLESVSHAATNQKRKMWISCSLILLSQAQHQESKKKENGKLCRQWKGSRLGLYLCRRRNRKSFPKQLPNHNRLPSHPQACALSFLAFPLCLFCLTPPTFRECLRSKVQGVFSSVSKQSSETSLQMESP